MPLRKDDTVLIRSLFELKAYNVSENFDQRLINSSFCTCALCGDYVAKKSPKTLPNRPDCYSSLRNR